MRQVHRRRLAVIAGVVVLLAIAAWLVLRALLWLPAGHGGDDIRVVIPQGASTSEIAGLLAQSHVVSSAFLFRVYLVLSGSQSRLQAGDYLFASNLTIGQTVSELVAGASAYNTVVVTIPEGFTVREIAATLAQSGVCSYRDFLHAADDGRYPQYPFWRQIPYNPKVRDHLEGYLFPDTYYFLRHEPVYRVITKILKETGVILSPVLLAQIHREHRTLQEIMTIASMVEREAKVSRERPLIASVIYNRLAANPPMRLQIDSTIVYALGGVTSLTEQDLQLKSPYNTYLYFGLPPGPIANPGLPSIEAALHPAHTPYLYYVAKGNGTGSSYFAVTYAEQVANVARRNHNLALRAHSGRTHA